MMKCSRKSCILMIQDDTIWDPDTVSHLRRSLNLKILAAELCIGFDMAVGRSELECWCWGKFKVGCVMVEMEMPRVAK